MYQKQLLQFTQRHCLPTFLLPKPKNPTENSLSVAVIFSTCDLIWEVPMSGSTFFTIVHMHYISPSFYVIIFHSYCNIS